MYSCGCQKAIISTQRGAIFTIFVVADVKNIALTFNICFVIYTWIKKTKQIQFKKVFMTTKLNQTGKMVGNLMEHIIGTLPSVY